MSSLSLMLAIGIAVAVGCYIAFCLLLFIFQRSLLYSPQPCALASSETTIQLKATDATLLVSVAIRNTPKALLYFGGKAEDVSLTLPSFAQAFPDYAIFMLHYRGYGGSGGRPSEAAIHRDAALLLHDVSSSFSEISVLGRSLGSGVALKLAAQAPLQRVVLITPYDSISNVAAAAYPLVPVRLLLIDRYESVRHAPAIRVPTTLVLAEHDDVIPRQHAENLAKHFAPGLARVVVLPGTDHNSIQLSPDYLAVLSAALR